MTIYLIIIMAVIYKTHIDMTQAFPCGVQAAVVTGGVWNLCGDKNCQGPILKTLWTMKGHVLGRHRYTRTDKVSRMSYAAVKAIPQLNWTGLDWKFGETETVVVTRLVYICS